MNKRQVIGWSLYDLANTSFSTLFISFFYSLFIVKILGGNELQYGMVFGISFILAGLFVPIIGALTDARGKKKQTLMIFTFICIAVTAFVGYTNFVPALILGVIALFFYHVCLDIYDAMLMDISTKKNRGIISGIGVAVGYIGAILSLVMAYLILSSMGWESERGIRYMFPAIAAFFLFFAVISFILMKEKKTKPIPFKTSVIKGFSEIKKTLTHIHKFKKVFLFLLSSFLYTDGMNIVIVFFYLFARDRIGIALQPFFFIFGSMAIASGIGALFFGKLSDKLGPKNTLIITQVIWIIVIVILFFSASFTAFLIAGTLGALALGGVWTTTRPMLISLAPKHKITEFFGFQGLTEKFSGGLGPVIFGAFVVWFNYQIALIIPLLSFILALFILAKIRLK